MPDSEPIEAKLKYPFYRLIIGKAEDRRTIGGSEFADEEPLGLQYCHGYADYTASYFNKLDELHVVQPELDFKI